jgi:hypothetical protein
MMELMVSSGMIFRARRGGVEQGNRSLSFIFIVLSCHHQHFLAVVDTEFFGNFFGLKPLLSPTKNSVSTLFRRELLLQLMNSSLV